jgi:hypothetical protein
MRRFAASGHCPGLRAAQNTTNFDIITPDGCRDLGEYLGISVIWPQYGRLKNNGMGYGEQRILHIGTTNSAHLNNTFNNATRAASQEARCPCLMRAQRWFV